MTSCCLRQQLRDVFHARISRLIVRSKASNLRSRLRFFSISVEYHFLKKAVTQLLHKIIWDHCSCLRVIFQIVALVDMVMLLKMSCLLLSKIEHTPFIIKKNNNNNSNNNNNNNNNKKHERDLGCFCEC